MPNNNEWTEEELNILKENYGRISVFDLSLKINRSTKAITIKANKLKISKEKHNMSKTRIYIIWAGMISRCKYVKHKAYLDYGGRGIKVCQEWSENFLNFNMWSMANGYKENLTIDRIDNDGDYCPENCRWATFEEQSNNKRTTRYLIAFGKKKTISEWIKDDRCLIKNRKTIQSRISRGWSDVKILSTPYLENDHHAKKYIGFGEEKTITNWLKDKRCIIKCDVLRDRVNAGWSIEDAITTEPKRKVSNKSSPS